MRTGDITSYNVSRENVNKGRPFFHFLSLPKLGIYFRAKDIKTSFRYESEI